MAGFLDCAFGSLEVAKYSDNTQCHHCHAEYPGDMCLCTILWAACREMVAQNQDVELPPLLSLNTLGEHLMFSFCCDEGAGPAILCIRG